MKNKKMTLGRWLGLILITLFLAGVDFTAIFAMRIGGNPWWWVGTASAGAIFLQIVPVFFAHMLKNYPTKWKHPSGKQDKPLEMFFLIFAISTTIAFLIGLAFLQNEINWQYMFIPILTTIAALVFAFAIFPKDCFFEKKCEEAKLAEKLANEELEAAKEECQQFLSNLFTDFRIASVDVFSSDEDINQACREKIPQLEREQIEQIHTAYPDLLRSEYYQAMEVYIMECRTKLLEIAQTQGVDQAILQQINSISIEEVVEQIPSWNADEKINELTERAKSIIPLDTHQIEVNV